MYQLGTKSRQNLATVHAHLQTVVKLAIARTRQDFSVHEGLRTAATQRAYVARGASQTMDSRHLAGPDGKARAVDLYAYINGVRFEEALYYPIAEAMRTAAIEANVPVRWGGCWQLLNGMTSEAAIKRAVAAYVASRRAQKRKAFVDLAHFELPKMACYP
jgi:peptidoglycan L-alanyl-D-glutamate endopeptidase CwlK